jgi:hypothetical protein
VGFPCSFISLCTSCFSIAAVIFSPDILCVYVCVSVSMHVLAQCAYVCFLVCVPYIPLYPPFFWKDLDSWFSCGGRRRVLHGETSNHGVRCIDTYNWDATSNSLTRLYPHRAPGMSLHTCMRSYVCMLARHFSHTPLSYTPLFSSFFVHPFQIQI